MLCFTLASPSLASKLEITLKCVFSEGVMISAFGSDLSFLLTWIQTQKKVQYKKLFKSLESSLISLYFISKEPDFLAPF